MKKINKCPYYVEDCPIDNPKPTPMKNPKWEIEYLEKFGGDVMYPEKYKSNQEALSFIRNIESSALETGRREGIEEIEHCMIKGEQAYHFDHEFLRAMKKLREIIEFQDKLKEK